MTPVPSARLLLAFCAMAQGWFAGAEPPVDCEPHGGRFDTDGELERFALRPPSLRVACLAVNEARDDGPDAAGIDCRMAAVAICDRNAGDGHGSQARLLAERVAFELARVQRAGRDAAWPGRLGWPQAAFSAAELAEGADPHRWGDISSPREIRAANLYRKELDRKDHAAWAVTWMQRIRALPSDFDLPLPAPALLPRTVLAGFAPDIGAGSEDAYETVAGDPDPVPGRDPGPGPGRPDPDPGETGDPDPGPGGRG